VDWTNITITVININDGPRLNVSQLTISFDEDSNGTSFELSDVFMDIDGDVLSYDHENSINLTISIEEGSVTIVSIPDWYGREVIQFTASDEFESVSINVTIDVSSINDAPTDVVIFAESVYMVGGDQIVNSSAIDIDTTNTHGDGLTFSWSSNITGEIGEGQSINLSLPVGHHLIILTVTDIDGLSETATMEIEIKPIEENGDGNGENGDDLPIALIMIIAIAILILIISLVVFLLIRKKQKEIEPQSQALEELPDAGDVDSFDGTGKQTDVSQQQEWIQNDPTLSEMNPPDTTLYPSETDQPMDQMPKPDVEEYPDDDISLEPDDMAQGVEDPHIQDNPEQEL
jgi:hypothetical protein